MMNAVAVRVERMDGWTAVVASFNWASKNIDVPLKQDIGSIITVPTANSGFTIQGLLCCRHCIRTLFYLVKVLSVMHYSQIL